MTCNEKEEEEKIKFTPKEKKKVNDVNDDLCHGISNFLISWTLSNSKYELKVRKEKERVKN